MPRLHSNQPTHCKVEAQGRTGRRFCVLHAGERARARAAAAVIAQHHKTPGPDLCLLLLPGLNRLCWDAVTHELDPFRRCCRLRWRLCACADVGQAGQVAGQAVRATGYRECASPCARRGAARPALVSLWRAAAAWGALKVATSAAGWRRVYQSRCRSSHCAARCATLAHTAKLLCVVTAYVATLAEAQSGTTG